MVSLPVILSRYIAYETRATDLLSGVFDSNGTDEDVYLYDTTTGINRLESHASGSETTTGNGESSWPRISGDGGSVAFRSGATDLVSDFVDGNAAGGTDVFVREVPPARRPLSATLQVHVTTEEDQGNSVVAMDDDGDFVLAWETDYDSVTYDYGVVVRRFNAAGEPQGGEIRVDAVEDVSKSLPSVAMDADGDFVVVWRNVNYGEESEIGLFARQYSAAGLPQADERVLNLPLQADAEQPLIAVAPDGSFVVATSNRPSGPRPGWGPAARARPARTADRGPSTWRPRRARSTRGWPA